MGDDIAKLMVRATVSGLLLVHGVHKLLNGIDPIKQMLSEHHLPEILAHGVYIGELAAPLLVLLGLFSRVGGALIMVNMLVAVYLVGAHNLLAINAQGGYALELEVFYFVAALSVVLGGAGRLSVGGIDGPLN